MAGVFFVPSVWGAAKPSPSKQAVVEFSLVDTVGKPSSLFLLPANPKAPLDLLFKGVIPEALNRYTGYTLEVADPPLKLNYQMEMEGKLPEVLHWEGFFSVKDRVQQGRQYFVRLLLHFPDRESVGSVWRPFTVKEARREESISVGEPLSLFVIPTGSFALMRAQTETGQSTFFPLLAAELDVVSRDRDHFVVGFQGTSNILFNKSNSEAGLYFSQIEVGYRRQLVGAPIRQPQDPFVPEFARRQVPETTLSRRSFGRAQNFSVGANFFYSTIRGVEGSQIDREYARQLSGFAGAFWADQSLFPFRLHLHGQVGYSLFRGAVVRVKGVGGLSFDRLPSVVPMLFVSYEQLMGRPASEEGRTADTIRNTLLSGGLELLFRI